MRFKNFEFVFEKVENMLKKDKNTAYQYFVLFPQCFHKPYFPESLKPGIVW